MIVRALNQSGAWQYGKGKNDYIKDQKALAQMLKTRLKSFLGDCFFALSDGIDWFNLNGSKDVLALRLAVASTILNTEGITALLDLSFNLSENTRVATITCSVETVYGRLNNLVIEQSTGL